MKGNSVITPEQAKKITGGRTPLVPVHYENAVKELAACLSLDDATIWADKADALAAWAKIYADNKVGRQAKQLKLHAYRRMGELAYQLHPKRNHYGRGPGARTALRDHGLSTSRTEQALMLARLPEKQFEHLINSPKPPAPSTFFEKHSHGGSEAWKIFAGSDDRSSPILWRGFCRKNPAANLARRLSGDECSRARVVLRDVLEWIDEFEQHLPKERK